MSMGDKPGDWMENPQNLANGVHFTLSALVMLVTAFFARLSPHVDVWLGGVEGFLVGFVLVKEYWYDLKYETGETVRTSTEDALGWLLGSGFFWALLLAGYWVGVWP